MSSSEMLVTPADGNVFADLGLAHAHGLWLRAQLMIEVKRFFADSAMTQRQAAKALGTTETRVNDVLNGRIDKCTIDRLVNMLAAVGGHVHLSVDTQAT